MAWLIPPGARSLPCSGEVLRHYREKRGWTQEELANRAGFTKRLVAKAEANGSLKPYSIEVLAETLSEGADEVFPEDLTTSPKELAIALLLAICDHESETVASCRQFLSDDLILYIPGGADCAPLSGVHRGVDGLDRYFRTFFRMFQRPDKELAKKTAVVAEDGNRVVVACFEKLANEFIPPGIDGAPLTMYMVFSRGKLCELQFVFDTVNMASILTAWREKYDSVEYLLQDYMPPWKSKEEPGN